MHGLANPFCRTVEAELYDKLATACSKRGSGFYAMVECAYTYGWRESELTNLRVRQVDLLNRVIRLDPGSTKNKKGRTVTMTDKVFMLLKECVAGKQQPDENVFTWPDGAAIKSFYGSWAKCCQEARITGLLFHDLRRTAVRNMVRAGIPEQQAMMISGHKTREVFARYDIVSERDIEDSVRKIENFQRAAQARKAKVLNFPATGTVSGTDESQTRVERTN